jgi:hypothetical protein
MLVGDAFEKDGKLSFMQHKDLLSLSLSCKMLFPLALEALSKEQLQSDP